MDEDYPLVHFHYKSFLFKDTNSSLQPMTRFTILHRCGVAPPSAAAAAEHRLPLTFFDMLWMYFPHIQRLLFYQHPCSTAVFQETIIPNLKNSLSKTLTNYLPLAGNFLYPQDDSGFPELRYVPGDSVAVTFAQWNQASDFNYLTGYQARDADEFHYLVPDTPRPVIEPNSGFQKTPLLVIQVTLFPGRGISVGIANHHVAGDASSIVGFIKAWSSTAKLGKLSENHTLPFYDRSVIKDPSGRAGIFWKQMRAFKIGAARPENFPTNRLRATFVLQKNEIQTLKNMVIAKKPDSIHLSSFTVAIAHVWDCFAKSTEESGESVDDNELEYFGFPVDARSRVDPPIPAAYFGNCVAFAVVESTHGRIKREDGFLVAAELFGTLISEKVNKKGEILRDADDWLVKYGPIVGKRAVGVSGSPKFDLYDADFGWGKAVKYEAVTIDGEKYSISLCKSRDSDGGLEIGVSLPKEKMDAFAAVFYDRLKN